MSSFESLYLIMPTKDLNLDFQSLCVCIFLSPNQSQLQLLVHRVFTCKGGRANP